jgi:hypothetical protein
MTTFLSWGESQIATLAAPQTKIFKDKNRKINIEKKFVNRVLYLKNNQN